MGADLIGSEPIYLISSEPIYGRRQNAVQSDCHYGELKVIFS